MDGVLPGGSIVVFQIPARPLLVICKLRAVVAFVEVLEHSREDLWFFGRQVDAFTRRLEELLSTEMGEVCRLAENVFVCCEEALRWPDADCNDGGVEIACDR